MASHHAAAVAALTDALTSLPPGYATTKAGCTKPQALSGSFNPGDDVVAWMTGKVSLEDVIRFHKAQLPSRGGHSATSDMSAAWQSLGAPETAEDDPDAYSATTASDASEPPSAPTVDQ